MSNDEKVPPAPPSLIEALRVVEEDLEVAPDVRAEIQLLRANLEDAIPISYVELGRSVTPLPGAGAGTGGPDSRIPSGTSEGAAHWHGEGSGYAPPLTEDDLSAVESKAGPASRAWLDQLQAWGPPTAQAAVNISIILNFLRPR